MRPDRRVVLMLLGLALIGCATAPASFCSRPGSMCPAPKPEADPFKIPDFDPMPGDPQRPIVASR